MNRRDSAPLVDKLEAALADSSEVFMPKGVDSAAYVAGIADSVRKHRCAPFPLAAVATEPGFPDLPVGETISGTCVAHHQGRWLVYDDSRDRFLCFWGTDQRHLGAPGIFGTPLYCWSA